MKKYLTNGQYLTTKEEKRSLFLHHTISTNAMSAWRWWNSTPDRVGTAYMIDRDGSIIECFDPKMWAFHLGVRGDDNWHEKHSIGIELVSAGPLRLEDDEYRFYPLWPNKLRYTVIPADEVHTFSKPWKGFKHWHKYTEDQIESVTWLIGRLALDFPGLGIDNDLMNIFEFNRSVLEDHKPGIWSHNTVREDKSDIYPDPAMIRGLLKVQKELTNIDKANYLPEASITSKSTRKSSRKGKSSSSSKP